jgi:Beta-lactamase
MLVRHLASMTSGHLADSWTRALTADSSEPVRGFLLVEPEREPGTVFAYNQAATYTLAAIIQRAAGESLIDYLRPRLFEPLGVDGVSWQQVPRGRVLGFTGLSATTETIAKLGQLYLQRGVWGGHRLLDAGWVAQATRFQVATSSASSPDWRRGYGYQFWMSRYGYRADGTCGQFCIVLPDHDAVIAITAATKNMQGVLDAVWSHLVPAFRTAGAPAGDADDALRSRLAAARLPPAAGRPDPPLAPGSWNGQVFTPAEGVCQAQPSLRRVCITRDEETDTWGICLAEPRSVLTLRLETGGWNVAAPASPPTAVSGGWTDADTLAVRVIFVETPHQLMITCSLRSRTFRACWRVPPPGNSPLSSLRAR